MMAEFSPWWCIGGRHSALGRERLRRFDWEPMASTKGTVFEDVAQEAAHDAVQPNGEKLRELFAVRQARKDPAKAKDTSSEMQASVVLHDADRVKQLGDARDPLPPPERAMPDSSGIVQRSFSVPVSGWSSRRSLRAPPCRRKRTLRSGMTKVRTFTIDVVITTRPPRPAESRLPMRQIGTRNSGATSGNLC